jgi:hypothetical protein
MSEVQADRAVPRLGPDAYAEWRSADIGVITDCLEGALILDLSGNAAGACVLDIGCLRAKEST